MALMELARVKNLGVLSLNEVQRCQSTTACASSHSRAFATAGFWLQPFASALEFPSFVS